MNRLTTFLFLLIIGSGFAQQIPFYNHNFINPFIYNPAFTGYNGNINAYLVRNDRNKSFDGGAINSYLTVDGAMNDGKQGLGLSVAYQTQGIQQQLGGSLSYAYKIKFNDKNNLRLGLQIGFLDNQLDASSINVENTDDPFLLDLNRNKLTYNATFGLLYSWRNTNIGFSIPQLMGNKIEYGTGDNRGYYQLERHYMLNLSHRINLSKDQNWSIKPNVILRYLPGLALQYDALLHADHQKWGWLAVGYKSDYAIEMNAGIRIFGLQIGYSYEYVMGSMANYVSGMNHEILLGYTFNNDKYKNRISELENQNKNYALQLSNNERKDSIAEPLISNNELQLIQRNLMLEDSLARMNYLYRTLKIENEELRAEVLAYREMLNQLEAQDEVIEDIDVETVTVPEDEKIIRTSGYQFVDLKNLSAPSGYYLINGVFSSRSNAMSQLENTRQLGNPDAYLLLNKTNRFYYVILFYSSDDRTVIQARKEYSKMSDVKAWVLEYFRMDD